MLPVLALVGRPNVGKSTLFNALTRTRDALVADVPGLTRDRKYGYARRDGLRLRGDRHGRPVEGTQGIERLMEEQTLKAVEEADRVLLMVDARAGLHARRPARRRASCAAAARTCSWSPTSRKGSTPAMAAAEFHRFGFGEPIAISSAHIQGLDDLHGARARRPGGFAARHLPEEVRDREIRVAVIGRPNVGKSTLINRLLGEERLITFDQPGTTRDTVFEVEFERDGQRFILIDTAGVRRRARVNETVEKFSVVKTLQAIEQANVVIGVVDAHDTVADQDASLLGLVAEQGRALVIAVNKWDGIAPDQRDTIRDGLDLKLDFLRFAPVHFISAKHGTGVGDLMGLGEARLTAPPWRRCRPRN